jgi:hypothetical protein
MSELLYPFTPRVTSILHMCCDHEHSARVYLHDYKRDYPLALKADISFSPRHSHCCRCRGFSLMHAVSLKECGVDGSPRLFVDNSAEAAQH